MRKKTIKVSPSARILTLGALAYKLGIKHRKSGSSKSNSLEWLNFIMKRKRYIYWSDKVKDSKGTAYKYFLLENIKRKVANYLFDCYDGKVR